MGVCTKERKGVTAEVGGAGFAGEKGGLLEVRRRLFRLLTNPKELC